MRYERVTLRDRPGWARLGELTGRDEAAVHDLATATAIGLLDGLLTGGDGLPPVAVADLTAGDRDRLLAAVYRRTYGDRIVSTLTCGGCARPFDLSFSLTALMATLDARAATAERLADGSVRLTDGVLVRPPTGRDECAVAGLPAPEAVHALYERCLVRAECPLSPEALDEALQAVAPVLDVDLDALCPECGRRQAARFDVQSFLLGSLVKERGQLLREVHRLAFAYGWSRDSILDLSRGDRRAYAALVDAELPLPRRRVVA